MRIGFIGGGNMAQALIGGLIARRLDASFVAIEPHPATRATLERLVPGVVVHDAAHADLGGCDAVIFAVKPQVFRDAATVAAPCLTGADGRGPLVISIAAGIRLAAIARWLGVDPAVRPLVRAMPNTPALIGAGITGLCATPATRTADRTLAGTLLSAVGEILWVDDEARLDAVTAVSGSGPGYVFAFIEALEEGAIALGFDADEARRLAVATFVGASRLAEQSDEPLSVLRERVTSKGGTTAAALAHLDASGCHAAIIDAIRKAALRSAEMGDEFGRER